VAIDGKHLATIGEKRLRALISAETSLDGDVLRWALKVVQLQVSEDRVYGLVRAHRAVLISSDAAVVIDQWPLKAGSNEIDTIAQTLEMLHSTPTESSSSVSCERSPSISSQFCAH
jgi:hypothetical protein